MELFLSRWLRAAHVEGVAISLQVVLAAFAFSFVIVIVLS